MSKSGDKKETHRKHERYECPPFFSACIMCGGKIEERAIVENLSLRGLSARSSCDFEEGADAEIDLRSSYTAPLRIHARVIWVTPPKGEGEPYCIGFSISRIRIFDWFKYMRLVKQIRRESW